MNILFMFYLPMIPYQGGIQRVTENLAVELQSRGHNVFYLSILPFEETDYQFPIPQFSIDYLTNYTKSVDEYIYLLKTNKIDVIINQQPRADLLRFLRIAPSHIKKITCYHGQPFPDESFTREQLKYYKRTGLREIIYKHFCMLFPSYYRKKTRKYAIDEWEDSISASDYICLLSDYYIRRVTRYMPDIDRTKLIAINNPCPLNFSNPILAEKEKKILWIGRHDNGTKNFPVFVDFWNQFYKSHSDWQAIVLGDGPDWEYNKSYTVKKNAKNIEFVGKVSNVQDYYKKSSFLFLTSYCEGWGMVLVEGMRFGCIPCAFDTYESLHDIIDERSGIIIPAYNIKCALKKISNVIDDTYSLNVLRINAQEKSYSFNIEKIVDQWEDLLKTNNYN